MTCAHRLINRGRRIECERPGCGFSVPEPDGYRSVVTGWRRR